MGQIAKGHAIGHLVLGGILCFSALLIIILSGVMLGKADVGAILAPWWVGLIILIPGILGVVAGITKNKCPAIAFLVLSIIILIVLGIITALMAIIVAVLALFKEATKDCTKNDATKTCHCKHDGTTFDMKGIDGDCSVMSDIHGLGTGVLAMMIIGCLVCFAGSILGCVSVCCNKSSEPSNTTVIIQQGNVAPQQGQPNPPPYNQPEPAKY